MGYYREFFKDDYDEIGTDDLQSALEVDGLDYFGDEYDQIDVHDLRNALNEVTTSQQGQ